jgi:hypothetical protein
MTLKAFIDESGKGDPLMFVMAGFIARAEQWADFNDDWGPEYFHMTNAVAQKEFARIQDKAAIIRKHQFPAIAVCIFMEDYNTIIKRRVSRRVDDPYFFGYHSIIELALMWEIEHGLDEPIDFIFDEQWAQSDYLQSIFTPLIEHLPPELKRRFGNRPIHMDDRNSPALQAADMLAWPLRRIAERARRNEPPDAFLNEIFRGVTLRRQDWNYERLSEFYRDASAEAVRSGRVFSYDFEIAAQNKDIIYHEFNQASLARATPGQMIPVLSIPAKGMGRFLLVHTCPLSGTPHLHRRFGDQCLAHLAERAERPVTQRQQV